MTFRARWRGAILLVLCGLACWNSQQGVFLLDDFASIHQNDSIRALWPLTKSLAPPNRGESVSGRPVVNLSLAANYAAGGLNPRGYHLVNVAIHLLCALLVMGIIGRLTRMPALGLVSASIWMVHPLQSEAVTYIVARTESLMALCYLLAIYASIRRWTVVSVVACAIGMASKESMVTAPIAIVLIDRAAFFNSFADAFKLRWRFYASLAGTWVILAALVASSPRANSAGFMIREDAAAGFTYGGYLLNQAELIPHYLRLLIIPTGLVLDYGQPKLLSVGEVLPGIAIVIGLIAAAGLLWKRRPALGLPPALALLTLAPTSLVPIITEVGAERRMYLASIALITGAVVMLSRIGLKGRAAVALSAVTIAILTSITIERNAEYHSSYGMWKTVVERRPHGRAYLNLAVEAEAIGRSSEVLPLLREAVDGYPDAEYALGDRLYRAGAYQEAIEHLENFRTLRPSHYQADAAKRVLIQSWTDLGIAHAAAGNTRDAIEAFRQSLALDPANPDLRRNLATAMQDAR
jgi:Flp pilus assembly protein TadD